MKPTVGCIVHFIRPISGEHLPAIVSGVNQDLTIRLHAMEPKQSLPVTVYDNVEEGQEAETERTWHWPEEAT